MQEAKTAVYHSDNYIYKRAKIENILAPARQLLSSSQGVIGVLLCLAILAISILAPYIAPADPFAVNAAAKLEPPSLAHILGTDSLGRDILSRLLYGARLSLLVGAGAVLFGIVFGAGLGIIAGYFGGRIDSLITRTMDVLLAFPGLMLALVISVLLGANLQNTIIALGITSVPRFARLIRAQVLTVKEREFVEAARALGASSLWIIREHILPRLVSLIAIEGSLSMAFAIMTEASLSFLGLGVGPPHASWGMMLKQGYQYLEVAPWVALSPAVAVFMAVLGFNFLAEALQTVFLSGKSK